MEETEKSNYNEGFEWNEFNDECMHIALEPLKEFNQTPGIKKPELLISTDPWIFY